MARPKSGMLGTGAAARAGRSVEKRKRKTKKRMGPVMEALRSTRKRKK